MFGGVSAEHEVSIITGLQVLEKINRDDYKPHAIYIDKNGDILYLGDIKKRSQFLQNRRVNAVFGHDKDGGFLKTDATFGRKIYPACAYLAFHGGTGESGQIQGFLDALGIPYTSANVESSAISMNKYLTKKVLAENGIPTIKALSFTSEEVSENVKNVSGKITSEIKLPLILKPVHLGSSIGIEIVKNKIELEKKLLELSRIDSEIMIEKFEDDFFELNCSVRKVNNKIETSEIEKPVSRDQILSFSDKYERGGKKQSEGMASLSREVPAKVSNLLSNEIKDYSKKIYEILKCRGVVRIDFMVCPKNKVYLVEVNPIPGSMAFYLWEAKGVSFKKQISDLINETINDFKNQNKTLEYSTDIVEKFIGSSTSH